MKSKLIFLIPVILLFAVVVIAAVIPERNAKKPYKFDKEGNLLRSSLDGYREWIYVGTPLTPNDLNPPEAAFPEFHNVYIHPKNYEYYKKNGKFADGTILIKELVGVSTKKASSGNGYFMGEFVGLEAEIKDSKQFPNEPGNWAYFSFGHAYPLAASAKAFPTAACNSCHQSAAADDFVFVQHYPVLREVKGLPSAATGSVKPSSGGGARADLPGGVPTEKKALFKYLQDGKYKDFYSESQIHPSAGPHDNVKVFFNSLLEASMKKGSKEHPRGSASIKEQYKDGSLYGWSVSVKVADEGNYGEGWYWFEVVSTTDIGEVKYDGVGDKFCSGCHIAGGIDLVRTRYPLN